LVAPLNLAHQAIKSHSRTRRWLSRWSPKIRTCLRRFGPFAMRLQKSGARQSGRYELRSRTRRKSCCPTARPSDTGSPRHWAIASEPSRADWLTKTRPTRRSWINCGEASRFNTSRSRAYRFRRLLGCSVTKGRVRSTTLSCVGPAVRHPPRATRSSFPRRDKAFSRAHLPRRPQKAEDWPT